MSMNNRPRLALASLLLVSSPLSALAQVHGKMGGGSNATMPGLIPGASLTNSGSVSMPLMPAANLNGMLAAPVPTVNSAMTPAASMVALDRSPAISLDGSEAKSRDVDAPAPTSEVPADDSVITHLIGHFWDDVYAGSIVNGALSEGWGDYALRRSPKISFDGSSPKSDGSLPTVPLTSRAIELNRSFSNFLDADNYTSRRFERIFLDFQSVNFSKLEISKVWKTNSERTVIRANALVGESVKLALRADYRMVSINLYVPGFFLKYFGAAMTPTERAQLTSVRDTLSELYELALAMSKPEGRNVKSLTKKILAAANAPVVALTQEAPTYAKSLYYGSNETELVPPASKNYVGSWVNYALGRSPEKISFDGSTAKDAKPALNPASPRLQFTAGMDEEQRQVFEAEFSKQDKRRLSNFLSPVIGRKRGQVELSVESAMDSEQFPQYFMPYKIGLAVRTGAKRVNYGHFFAGLNTYTGEIVYAWTKQQGRAMRAPVTGPEAAGSSEEILIDIGAAVELYHGKGSAQVESYDTKAFDLKKSVAAWEKFPNSGPTYYKTTSGVDKTIAQLKTEERLQSSLTAAFLAKTLDHLQKTGRLKAVLSRTVLSTDKTLKSHFFLRIYTKDGYVLNVHFAFGRAPIMKLAASKPKETASSLKIFSEIKEKVYVHKGIKLDNPYDMAKFKLKEPVAGLEKLLSDDTAHQYKTTVGADDVISLLKNDTGLHLWLREGTAAYLATRLEEMKASKLLKTVVARTAVYDDKARTAFYFFVIFANDGHALHLRFKMGDL